MHRCLIYKTLLGMDKILFESEVCKYLNLPNIPKKEWDKKTPFNKGVAIVDLAFGNKAYAVARFDVEKEKTPTIVKVFASEPFYGIDKIFIVPDYMETDMNDADLDDESKKKAEELAKQADELENEGLEVVEHNDNENPYLFDNITNDEEAIAFITAYNQKNGIKGAVPRKHDTILMRLSVIYADLKKASGIDDGDKNDAVGQEQEKVEE